MPQVPWELSGRGPAARVISTLWTLLRPWSRAQAFARGTPGEAIRFALTVSLPAASVALIIPATRTLLFIPGARIEVIVGARPSAIGLDVARAVGLGIATTFSVSALLLGALFVLSGFRDGRLWARHTLYWSWLYPAVMLVQSVPAWLGASEFVGAGATFGVMFVWWLSLWFTVRRARGAGIPMALFTSVPAGFAWMFAVAVANLLTVAPVVDPEAVRTGAEAPSTGAEAPSTLPGAD